MAKKSLIQSAIKGIFRRNTSHPDVWDLNPDTGDKMPFKWFRLSEPREHYLTAQGALKVAESHHNGVKVLHTGLRRTVDEMIFAGNLYNPVNEKRSLLLFGCDPVAHTITVYLFANRNPRNINKYVEEVQND